MRHFLVFFFFVLTCLPLAAQQREYIWPAGRMPDAQVGQIAAMTDEAEAPGFLPEAHFCRRRTGFRIWSGFRRRRTT